MVLVILLVISSTIGERASAENPERETTITSSYLEYEWWMISWKDNEILCRLYTDHEGLPSSEEVIDQCGTILEEIWRTIPPCNFIEIGLKNSSKCAGVYLHLARIRPKEREVHIVLPPPVVWVDLEGCDPVAPQNICPVIPRLLLTAEEPLPNESITAINGTYGGVPFSCSGDTCSVQLRPTGMMGVTVEFWADSSYGDSSERYTALVRVVDTGVPIVPGSGGWHVDVISSQWIGPPIASCVGIWNAFPPVGEPPVWLSTPRESAFLASDEPYFYLAGRMIAQGLVDARSCTTGGLQPNGYADACGLEAASAAIQPWQNQFDNSIIEIALETGVPAQLMKNLFAQESQFWPGMFRVPYEFGLGQITDHGADSILLYDDEFYDQFCPLVLHEVTCEQGYLHLDDEQQEILRGAVALQAYANCETCPTGIDLKNTYFSISLFANTLVANCAQVNQTIYNAAEASSGAVSTYADLWRFTVANYHAGPGCVSYAIHQTWNSGLPLTWENVKTRFTVPCQGVIPYVDTITDVEDTAGSQDIQTPTLTPTPSPTPSPTPITATPTPTPTPTSTPLP